MHCLRYKPPQRQRGAALVVALLVFAICTALVVAMKSEFTLFYQRGANLFIDQQAQAYLRGAEQLAALALVADYDADALAEAPRDHLQEVWAQPATYALEDGGWLSGDLQDLQGRFNLNWLADAPGDDQTGQPQQLTPAQRQFIRLLQALGEPELSEQQAAEITHSIKDWLDADQRVSANGAEDDFYYGRTPAHRAANQPMASVSELRAVANVTPEVYCALQSLVTVWPQQPAPLNIDTAPAILLRTINDTGDLSPLSESEAEALLAQREEVGFGSVAEFLQHPVLAGKQLADMGSLLGVRSGWFLLNASVKVAERSAHLYSVLRRERRSIESVSRYTAVADPACMRRRVDEGDNGAS